MRRSSSSRGCCPRARGCSGCGSTTSSRCRARWTQLLGPRDVVDDDRGPEAVVEVLVDLPAVPQRQEDAAQAAAVRGEHLLGDAAEREHLAVEDDFALIARPHTGRPVNADTGAATIVTPAEVPPWAPRPSGRADARRCRDARPVKAVAGGGSSRSSSAAAGRATARPTPPKIIYCTAVAEPVVLPPEPAAGRAEAKAARQGRPTAARKR